MRRTPGTHPARKSTVAEILTVGTELLLGEIVDTNARHIARRLRACGIEVYRTQTVGDNPGRIATAITEAASRADIIVTTGGLGPTVDDVTREAVAEAAGDDLVFRPGLWQLVADQFRRFGSEPSDNNRRQAELPSRATAIPNSVGTAPAFSCDLENATLFALPGVPREMEHLLETAVLPAIQERFGVHGVLLTRIVRTAGLGESAVDEAIAHLEEGTNPTVGLAAHPGGVDIRITAKANSEDEAAALLSPIEKHVVQCFGKAVFGFDDQTIEEVVLAALADGGHSLVTGEHGTRGMLAGRIEGALAKVEAAVGLAGEPDNGELSVKAAQRSASAVIVRGSEADDRGMGADHRGSGADQRSSGASYPGSVADHRSLGASFLGGVVWAQAPESLESEVDALSRDRGAAAVLAVTVEPAVDDRDPAGVTVTRVLARLPAGAKGVTFKSGGHSDLAPERAAVLALNTLRLLLQKESRL